MQTATNESQFEPELAVLVAAAGDAVGTSHAGAPAEGVGGAAIDWERVYALARRHWLVPQLDAYLDDAAALDPPAELRAAIADEAVAYHHDNLRFAGELHRLVDEFDAADVRAIPFKGPVVAVVAYGSLGLRNFADVDFFVSPEDLPDAAAVLEAEGYALATDLGPYALEDAPSALRRASLPFPSEVVFTDRERGLEVELRLSYGSAFGDGAVDVDAFWSDRTTVEIAGRAAPVLSPTDRLVELSNHGAKHSWRRLEWIAGLAGVATNTDVDWSLARRRARQRGVLPELYLGVRVMDLFFDVDVPDDVALAARSEHVASVAASIRDRYVRDPMAFPHMLDHLRTRGRLHGDTVARHLRYVSRPKPEDYRVLPLPEPLWPLYRVVRLLRGSKQFLATE